MRGLSKMPLSFWFAFSIFVAYATYNPWYSMADFASMDVFWGIKVVVAGFYCGVLLLYVTEGSKSLSPMGLLVLVVIMIGAVTTLTNAHLLSFGTIQYWVQVPIGVALFLALRWGAIYRAITGRVAVNTANDDNNIGHHHG